jgi:hypothetical protein
LLPTAHTYSLAAARSEALHSVAEATTSRMVKKVVRRLRYSEEYCYGSGSVLIGSRSQAATSVQAVRPDSISQTGTTTRLCRLTFIVFQLGMIAIGGATIVGKLIGLWVAQRDLKQAVNA